MKKTLLVLTILFIAGSTNLISQVSGLFFSEYCEGSSNNKYIEIYNATGDTITLSDFNILTNYNGGAWTGMHSFPVGSVLAPNDVWIIANSAADPTILAVADEVFPYNASGYIVGFNGNDVRAIVKIVPPDTTVIDYIGRYDLIDPGNGWEVAGVSNATKDHTLVRKPSVCQGNPDWDAAAGTDSANSEWIVYPVDDFSHMGSHQSDCFNLNLVINEFMADNDSVYLDPTSNSYDDWVEIFNPSNNPININGWCLTDDINDTTQYVFPDTTVSPGNYLIVWCDNDFGDPGLHTNFALSKSGEEIYLFDNAMKKVDGTIFGNQKTDTSFARIPNGTGNFVFAKPTPMAVNELFPVPTVDTIPPVVVDAYANSLTEITVVFSEAVDTTAENTANYNGLGLILDASRSMYLDTVTLLLAVPLQICVYDTLIVSNVSDTSANVMAMPQEFPVIFGCSPPEIVITEIMYNPPEVGNDSLEFIELYNNGNGAVDLDGYSFTQGVTYTFPSVIINPGEYIVVGINANAFQNTFGLNAYEWSGALSNGGEDIELTDDKGNVIDYVDYDDKMPWDTLADGTGPSLTLCDPDDDNTDPANWKASIKFAAVNANGDSIFATPGAPCMTVGIQPRIAEAEFVKLYPNPASEYFIIEMPSTGNFEVLVYSAIGKVVFSATFLNDKTIIATSEWETGIYFINIRSRDNVKYFTKKLVLHK